jgi:phosphohistidine phosphatase
MPPEAKDEKPESDKATSSAYELYILRHGAAVTRGVSEDSKRPLTPVGKRKMEEIASGLRRLGVDPDWIVSSPLERAVETAEIVAESLPAKVPLEFSDALRPGGSAEALISLLAKHSSRRRVLVVGHEPDLGQMAGRLIGAGRSAHLAFKKGGCCLITFREFPPQSPGELVWWLTPRVLRKLG